MGKIVAKIQITGYSDDLIEIEGTIEEELVALHDGAEGDLLTFSDGTVLRINYSKGGIWRITLVAQGSAVMTKDENPEDDDDRYSDVVTLEGDIKWIVHNNRFIR